MNRLIPIGYVRKSHGTNGEVQCLMDNDLFFDLDPDFIFIELEAIPVPFRVLDWHTKGDDALMQLKGIDSEQKANRLISAKIFMEQDDSSSDNTDSTQTLTWASLAGRQLVDDEQGPQGLIEHVDETTANILLFLDNGRILPIHEDFIVDITDTQLTTHYTFLIQ